MSVLCSGLPVEPGNLRDVSLRVQHRIETLCVACTAPGFRDGLLHTPPFHPPPSQHRRRYRITPSDMSIKVPSLCKYEGRPSFDLASVDVCSPPPAYCVCATPTRVLFSPVVVGACHVSAGPGVCWLPSGTYSVHGQLWQPQRAACRTRTTCFLEPLFERCICEESPPMSPESLSPS